MPLNRDELAARLLQTFIAELEDQVASLNRHLLALDTNPNSADDRRGAFRVLHTLKGAARAAGVPVVEAACHRLEALLSELRDETRVLDAETLALFFRSADALADAARRLRAGESLTDAPIATALEGDANNRRDIRKVSPPAPQQLSASSQPVTPPTPALSDHVASANVEMPVAIEIPAQDATPPVASANTPVAADVRVRAEQLDALLGASSRLLIGSGQLDDLQERLEELRNTVLSAVTRRVNVTPEHRLHELEDIFRVVSRDLQRLTLEAADTARTLSAISTDIGTGVRALRLRPFGDAIDMLPRVVRDAAQATGRDVELEITGNEVQADRTVLDEMREAVLHLVRNAIAHGIEPASTRAARGKPPTGTVRVAAHILADHLIVIVTDDGAGIDVAAIRRALESRGESVSQDDRTVVRRLFEGGISTRSAVDAIAGRGVGLDAVRAAMSRVRGTVDVSWVPGQGAMFTLEAPVALATIRAVLVAVGTHIVAIPSAYIDRLVRLRADAIRITEGRPVITLGDAPIPLASLARVLGPPMVERPASDITEAVVLTAGGRQVAMAVDDLIGEEEIVVRPVLNKGRRELPFVSGAALLASGKVALVANANALVTTGVGTGANTVTAVENTSVHTARRIIVADDSITTRTLEQSVLETAGYQVTTAVDGADAWRILQERGADLVVSDVEMPRMDGFTLCQTMRASSRFRDTPVILVTALETADDRARGIEAGADAYLAKSSFDQETLLDTIRQLIG